MNGLVRYISALSDHIQWVSVLWMAKDNKKHIIVPVLAPSSLCVGLFAKFEAVAAVWVTPARPGPEPRRGGRGISWQRWDLTNFGISFVQVYNISPVSQTNGSSLQLFQELSSFKHSLAAASMDGNCKSFLTEPGRWMMKKVGVRNVRLINLTSTSDRYKLLERSSTLHHLSSLITSQMIWQLSLKVSLFRCLSGHSVPVGSTI